MPTNELEGVIREEIQGSGPISFARFMELALYHDRLGYYRISRDPFGTGGDFYTAAQLQPLFGEVIGNMISKIERLSSCRGEFELLELGAGRAELRSALSDRWSYRAFDFDTAPLPDSLSGVVLANEFFDALPVHLLRRNNRSKWTELLVQWRGAQFHLTPSTQELRPDLKEYAALYGGQIAAGGLMEVNLNAAVWMRRIASLLRCGGFLIFDYGYTKEELLRFPRGSLMSYREHVAEANILSHPGMRDITSHVNFSYLASIAVENGFRIQTNALLGPFIAAEWQDLQQRLETADQRFRLQWKQLVFGMGETFRVMLLEKAETKEKPPSSLGG